MPFVVLCKGEQYNYKAGGIVFDRGVPTEVSDEQWDELHQRGGKFRLMNDDELFAQPTNDGDTPYTNFVPPKNSFDEDDLNGKSILLKRQGGIGDAVFTVQCAAYIKQKYPGAYVALAVADNAIPLVALCDCVDEALSISESSTVDAVHRFQYIVNFAKIIEARQIDDLDYYVAHFERMGLKEPPPDEMPRVTVNRVLLHRELQDRAQTVLNTQGVGDEPYVVLVTGASNPLKRINAERINEIVEGLARPSGEQPPLHVLCLSGKHPLDRRYKSSTAYASSYVSEDAALSAELIRRASCVVGGDTGFTQFAAAIGVPTVSLWGPTDDTLSIAHAPAPQRRFRGDKPCQPCRTLRQARCPYFKGGYADCMRNQNTGAIVDAVRELLRDVPEHVARKLDASALVSKDKDTYVASHADAAQCRVAVLIDHGKHYTGGGMYAYMLARLLQRNALIDVTVHTDTSKLVYARDNADVTVQRTLVADKAAGRYRCDALQGYDVVIATPPFSGTLMQEWKAQNPHGVGICLVYETPNYIARYRAGRDAREDYWTAYKAAMLDADYLWVISKTVKAALAEWDEAFAKKTSDVVHPAVDTEIAATLLRPDDALVSRRRVVLIARNMQYKRLAETIEIVAHDVLRERATTEEPWEIAVIGDNADKLRSRVRPEYLADDAAVRVTLMENVPEYDKLLLLGSSRAYVHASDFEGFGIPIAEAMHMRVPALCKPLEVLKECYKEQPFYYDDDDALCATLNEIFDAQDAPDSEEGRTLTQCLDGAAQFVAQRYTMTKLSARLQLIFERRKKLKALRGEAELRVVESKRKNLSHLRVAFVTSWGTQCGIAETTRNILDELNVVYKIFAARENESRLLHEDDRSVRCWDRAFLSTSQLRSRLMEFAPNVVHFEHEFSFFRNERQLFALFYDLRALGIKVVVTVHTYLPCTFIDELEQNVDAIVLTKQHPELSDKGVYRTINLPAIKEGRIDMHDARIAVEQRGVELIAGTFGMWNPHKGFKEFLATYNDVSAKCGDKTRYLTLGYADPKSRYHRDVTGEFRAYMDSGRWIRKAGYHDPQKLMQWLCACNVLVFNYNVIGHYSASAAARTGMAAGRPLVVTNSPMFSEFQHEEQVLKVDFGDHAALADAIVRLYRDRDLSAHLVRNADAYLNECTPHRVARAHEDLYTSLVEGDASKQEGAA